MIVGTVKGLWRYPVKSLLGETCENLIIDKRGVQGDRKYAISTAEGKFGSGKSTRRFRRINNLLNLQASCQKDQLHISFPDGTIIRKNDPIIHAALSDYLGQEVTLTSEQSISHFDAGAIHMLTTASLNWLCEKLPQSTIDERRFRPNIVIENNTSTAIELTWIGSRMQIGSTIFQIEEATEHCVMTTLEQQDLPKDPDIMRKISRELDAQFGVYAKIIEPGNVCLEDTVKLLDV
ncbi:MAG: MOSC domain-containing protein [Sneathiella sp.]|nr:MOSC domain-containing protein [Sneathiella sp.]